MKKLSVVGLLVASAAALGGEAHADVMFVEGNVAHAPFTNCISGSPTSLVAGYAVDPVLDLPQIGDGTELRGIALGNANCGDDVTLEFFIPPGAHFDSGRPTVCNIISPQGVVSPLQPSRFNFCLNVLDPEPRNSFGGRVFARVSGLALNFMFEVRVPIVFDQQFDDAPLGVSANTLFGGIHANVLASSPFQPPLNEFALGQDIGLLGSSAPGLPVAFSNDDGSFNVTNRGAGIFPDLVRQVGVQRLSGDFNADGLTDFALIGGPGWQSIPVAISNGDGKFTVTNMFVGSFGNLFGASNAKALVGDFNHDGQSDIALTGGNWSSIPVAFSAGGGSFNVTNQPVPLFPQFAAVSGAKPLVGDFNKDGFADLALLGGTGMNTIPVAMSFGNGTFAVTNLQASSVFCGVFCNGANFPFLAQFPGTKFTTGDFNADGYTDLALAGAPNGFPGSGTVVTALSLGNGSFSIRTASVGTFAATAQSANAKLLSGDFNGDGYSDLTLIGQGGPKMPVALSTNFGNYSFADFLVNDFGSWALAPNVKIVTGDYNRDGKTDVALVGGSGWGSIPVAFSVGWGIWNVTNKAVRRMPSWAGESNTTALSGHVDWN